KEYIARGTYIYPPRPSLRIVTDIFAYCAKEVPRWNTISISGYHIREAGSTAAQEVAFTLADGIAYVQAAVDAGLNVDEFAPRIALRTQQVIGYESGIADTADALAGSYAIEHLTNEIERLATDYICKIDDIGGMLTAIETGFVQREIERAAYDYQRAVEAGEQVVVGV